MTQITPTEHGNWHVINGELVDIDKQPPAAQPAPTEAEDAPRRKGKDKPSNNEE